MKTTADDWEHWAPGEAQERGLGRAILTRSAQMAGSREDHRPSWSTEALPAPHGQSQSSSLPLCQLVPPGMPFYIPLPGECLPNFKDLALVWFSWRNLPQYRSRAHHAHTIVFTPGNGHFPVISLISGLCAILGQCTPPGRPHPESREDPSTL